MVPRDRILIASGDRMRTSCRHGDFQARFFKIRKSCNYKQLILFQFFMLFLVSFGTVWKHLTLTGTTWAQSSFGKNNDIFFLNRPFGHQNSRFKPKKGRYF